MTGNDVALDTSAAVRLLNDAALASSFLSQTGRVCLPAVAAGELLYGAMNSAHHKSNVPRYRQFIDHCELLPVTLSTADIYAAIRMKLKEKGLPIPDSDVWIAAAAIEHGLPIVSTDRHFSYITDLTLQTFDPKS